jgi:heptosyltransferase II
MGLMQVSGSKKLPLAGIHNILIRGTNWIGDVVMSLPAVEALRDAYPHSRISVLAKPWVADLFHLSPAVDEVIVYERPGRHEGMAGLWRLTGELKAKRFNMAVLLQNAIEAAIIALLAGIPIRAGYNTDGRGMLLTHSVKRTAEIRKVHQSLYYLEMLKSLGIEGRDHPFLLNSGPEYGSLGDELIGKFMIEKDHPLIGLAPGAAYGPAKRWHPERFADVSDRLVDRFDARVLLFGSAQDRESLDAVQKHARHPFMNLAGKTTLKEVIALMTRLHLFISNDSGLMHLAAALGIPTVAVFGSTNPVTTSPLGGKTAVIHKSVECAPCLKKSCPTDFKCMDMITADEVYRAAESFLLERTG